LDIEKKTEGDHKGRPYDVRGRGSVLTVVFGAFSINMRDFNFDVGASLVGALTI